MSPDDSLTLVPATHDLEIDYTALSLPIPERNPFRYMLEGAFVRDLVKQDLVSLGNTGRRVHSRCRGSARSG